MSAEDDETFEDKVLELLEAQLVAQRSTSLYVGILAYVTIALIVLSVVGAAVTWALWK